jgi:DNA-binding response OmpR family regulator
MTLILAVDDDSDVLQTIKISLMRHGYQVSCATSGHAALVQVQQALPDLVLLDMAMPDLDGLEVCRQLRAQAATAQIPILFLTANDTAAGRVAGFSAGANDYLVKPFDLRELNVRIQTLLRYEPQDAPGIRSAQIQVGDLILNCRTFDLTVAGRHVALTPIEFELLRYMMSRPNQTIASEQLLCDVWHLPANSGKTELVRAHIKNLRSKIECDPQNPVYLKTGERSGYAIVSAPPPAST